MTWIKHMLAALFASHTAHIDLMHFEPLPPDQGTYTVGSRVKVWRCDALPPLDYRQFVLLYCVDARGNAVRLLVESVVSP